MFPYILVGRLWPPQEVRVLGVDLDDVGLRPAVAGVMEGVSTRASNCTAQTCPLLLLSASSIQSRVPIKNQQDWSFLFSFQAP